MSSKGHLSARRLRRSRVLRAYDSADAITLLGADGAAQRLSGDSAALVRAILELTAVPRTRDEILARIAELAGEPDAAADVVDEALGVLTACGALGEADAPVQAAPRAPRPRGRVVLGLTGAIAAMGAPAAVDQLLARGFEVRVAATRNALRFVSALSIEALTHAPVCASLWPSDARAPVPHLELAGWADIVVIYPASAATLGRIAQGLCADVVSALAISARCPVLLAPSMNGAMLEAPAVQRNLAQLREDGFLIAHPAAGVEVADAPAARRPAVGPAPPAAVVADLVASILAERAAAGAPAAPCPIGPRATAPQPAPSAARWDAVYREADARGPCWSTEVLDADIGALLSRCGERGLLLDIGTGLGTAALEAARRGFFVVATDVSPRALSLARDRAADLPITWTEDDICATRLRARFDVVLDRGCLHGLSADRQAAYAAAVAALSRPGGWLILKCHSALASAELGTQRFDEGAVQALLGGAFELLSAAPSTLPGPDGEGPPALLCLLRRRG